MLDDAVTPNGKRHCLPRTKEDVLSEFKDIFAGIGKQLSAISSDRSSRQRVWRSTTKRLRSLNRWKHQRQESSTQFPGNGHLFETLLSQVDEAIRTTPTAASGRNRLDLGLFPSRGLRCHQRRTLHDPSTRVVWPESRTRYSYWCFHERIGMYVSRTPTAPAAERYSSIERKLLGMVFAMDRLHNYMFGEPVRVLTDHKPLEIIWKKSIATASIATSSEACKIRNSSWVHLREGQLNCRRH